MPLWGTTDRANNSPQYAVSQVHAVPNTANRDALYGNSTANAFINSVTIGVFGISPAEIKNPKGKVASLSVTNTGSGFTARPTVTIGGDGANATATAVGIVVGAVAGNAGADYANGDTLTIAGGTGTAAVVTVTAISNTGGVTNVAISNTGAYTALPTLSNNNVTGGNGTGGRITLTIGLGPITVTAAGFGYTTANVTIGGTGGSGATANIALRKFEVAGTPGPGWALRTEGSGNRANRVNYELLVAGRSLTSDGTDDTQLPE